jgi:hypothetical protein
MMKGEKSVLSGFAQKLWIDRIPQLKQQFKLPSALADGSKRFN